MVGLVSVFLHFRNFFAVFLRRDFERRVPKTLFEHGRPYNQKNEQQNRQ